MKLQKKPLNILLLLFAILLGGTAVWLFRLPPVVLSRQDNKDNKSSDIKSNKDTLNSSKDLLISSEVLQPEKANDSVGNVVYSTSKQIEIKATNLPQADISTMLSGHPFFNEAKKVLSGRLEETDSLSRRKILDYCEHFRAAYPTRDIDFLRQVFSDNALIIVGTTVKSSSSNKKQVQSSPKVTYSIRSKQQYLERLQEIFNSNKKIDVRFSDFRIMRHPTVNGIYGVSMLQSYKSDRYSDEGYLFLLWDFRNPSMPKIHVRTWQPERSIHMDEDRIDISDFNLE